MIMNPVIQGGGTEKVYKITDESGHMLNGELRRAGEIVTSREPDMSISPLVIEAEDGKEIPYFTSGPNRTTLLFVMPAQNIRIYYGSL